MIALAFTYIELARARNWWQNLPRQHYTFRVFRTEGAWRHTTGWSRLRDRVNWEVTGCVVGSGLYFCILDDSRFSRPAEEHPWL